MSSYPVSDPILYQTPCVGLPDGSCQGQQICYVQPKQQLYQETSYSQQLKENKQKSKGIVCMRVCVHV